MTAGSASSRRPCECRPHTDDMIVRKPGDKFRTTQASGPPRPRATGLTCGGLGGGAQVAPRGGHADQRDRAGDGV